MGRFWRPLALPGAHSYQGVRGESNPPLRRSQRRVPHRYTTDTINQRKERESNPQGRVRAQPLSGRFPSPFGWPFRKSSRWTRTTDLPHVTGTSYRWTTGLCSTPTRSRTRNASVETRHDVRFTTGVERKARDSNPHPLAGNRRSRSARPTVSGYLP